MARNYRRRRNDARELEIFRAVLDGTSIGVLAYRNNLTRQRISWLVDRMAHDMLNVPGQPPLPAIEAKVSIPSMREWADYWRAAANRYEPTVIPPTLIEGVA